MSVWRHLRAVLQLPFMVTIVIPGLLLSPWRPIGWRPLLAPIGALIAAAGLFLVAVTVRQFAQQGNGTLAPWDSPRRLVVQGAYRYTRNPMITGVIAILLGEALMTGACPLFTWFAIFVGVNVTYIPLLEEPGLIKRFGDDYRLYRANVPRWVPRLRPWNPPDHGVE